MILAAILSSCGDQEDAIEKRDIYYCDAETIVYDGSSEFLVDEGGAHYIGADQRTTLKSHSGDYSLLLDSVNQFGYTIIIEYLKPGDQFLIESWQMVEGNEQPCVLVAAGADNSFYHADNTIIEKFGEWLRIETYLELPENFGETKLSFYVWNNNKSTVYVDDFKVTRYHHIIDHEAFELDKLHISLEKVAFSHLAAIRDTAFEEGIHRRKGNDYVNANIFYQGDSLAAKIRLKGDGLDHFMGNKWSFRIKLTSALKDGLQIFSIQTPSTRGYLNEYVYHKLLERENVLSPEYRFVQVYLNGESLGIYALEEHWTSRMIERQSKPEGIILKFDDKIFWQARPKDSSTIKMIAKAEIITYGKAKGKPDRKNDISNAISVLRGYQFQNPSCYDSFDLSQMGRYYALCDVTRAYHAMGWINIRFYYNFSRKKMEAIGYDAYPGTYHLTWGSPYLGLTPKPGKYQRFSTEAIVYDIFKHPDMAPQYFKHLDVYSDSAYVQQVLSELSSELDFYESQIRIEYPRYVYDRGFLFTNAREIRSALRDTIY